MNTRFLPFVICIAAAPAAAQETFPATLAGHAFLPALSLVAPPADAPKDALISGKFTGPARNGTPMSVPGDTGAMHGNRPTGISLPFNGQPLQGFSGFAMHRADDGSIYVLTDNGFGSKANSPDTMLFFSRMVPDFETGEVEIRETVFLHDPDFKVPFRISWEGSESRYLTGADFDPATREWTGGSFKFRLAEGATAIGDFNFIDETRALVVERDNGEGEPSLKCAAEPKADCFPNPAMVKHVVLIDTSAVDEDGYVRRIGQIDLMNIADPEGRARIATDGGEAGRFSLPFFTIDDVMRVDDTHIMVAVDNNLPFSSGRKLDAAADNEVVLLSVPELLAAR